MKSIFRLPQGWLTKIQRVGKLVRLTGFLALFSGCATNPGSPPSATPTVSGYISVGSQMNFNSNPSK